jgi:dTDP-4-amino-4,6-dideoxygalactose transaminase
VSPLEPTKRPFHDLRPGFTGQRAEILAAITRVLERGWYILGEELAAFERDFALFVGAKQAIGVGNATDALEIALRALDVKPGDDVAVPALTAAPTAMAVVAAGARPVIVDVEPATLTMDPAALARAITPKTKAIVPVHLYGQCADLASIGELARRKGLPILEDCAQAHGATYHARGAGTFGAAAAWSFYPTKNLGAFGDAGAITTDEPHLAERMRRLRNYGAIAEYDFAEPGRNSRLDELHAAILSVKLKSVADGNERRRAHARRYLAEVKNPLVTLPAEGAGSGHVWHQFVVRCAKRDLLRAFLLARGIETLIHYPRPLHRMKAFAGEVALVPSPPLEAERACAEILSLPIYPELPADDQDAVIAAVNAFRG